MSKIADEIDYEYKLKKAYEKKQAKRKNECVECKGKNKDECKSEYK